MADTSWSYTYNCIPVFHHPGRPRRVLAEIMAQLDTDKIGPVVMAFCQRAAVHGVGDLPVKRLFDELAGQRK